MPRSFISRGVMARAACLAWALSAAGAVQAAVSLGSTRLVITAPQAGATLEVRNEGTAPVLLQLWLDAGDPAVAPEEVVVPVIAETPVMRLEAGGQRAVRLHFTGQPAPAPNRESLYWLNVQEVPVQAEATALPLLQVAFRTRIKVMYRPQAVPRGAARAWEGLQFDLVGQGDARVLRIRNPSRVHVTLLSLSAAQAAVPVPSEGLLVPEGEMQAGLSALQAEALARGLPLEFSCIDDAGNLVGASVRVPPARLP